MSDPSSSSRLEDLQMRWQQDPSSRIYLQLAEEYRRLDRHPEAIDILKRGLTQRPNDLSGQVALGRCHLEMDERDQAVQVFETVLGRDPAHMVANKLLLETFLKAGDAAKAGERLDLYKLLNPSDPDIETLEGQLRGLRSQPAAEPAAAPAPAAPAALAAAPAAPAVPAASVPAAPAPAAAAPAAPEVPAAPAAPVPVAPEPVVAPEPAPAAPVLPEPAPAPAVEAAPAAVFDLEAPALAAPELPAPPEPEAPPFFESVPEPPTAEAAPAAPPASDDIFQLDPLPAAASAPAGDDIFQLDAPSAAPAADANLDALWDLGAPSAELEAPVPELEAAAPEADSLFGDLGVPEASSPPVALAVAEPAVELEPEFAPEVAPPMTAFEPEELPPAPTMEAFEPEAPAEAVVEEVDPLVEVAEPVATFEPPAAAAPDEVVAEDPATATLGQLYLKQGHVIEAERIFRQVLRHDSTNSGAMAGLAQIRGETGLNAHALLAKSNEDTAPAGLTDKKVRLLRSYIQHLRSGEIHVR